jgi:microcystin-dependent protein
MSTNYVGEIRMFGGNFPPAGWMFCSGQLLPISEYDTLFNLIGTTYGGDGQSTFGLPDLQCRIPLHMGTGTSGTNYNIGEKAGVESVTLTTQQIPNHVHDYRASTATGGQNLPTSAYAASPTGVKVYAPATPAASLNAAAIGSQGSGGNQPHDNMMPFLAVSFIISLYGIYPSPT